MDTGNAVIGGLAIVVVGLVGYSIVSSMNRASLSAGAGGVQSTTVNQGPALDGDSAGGVLFGLFSGLGPLVAGIGSAVAANRTPEGKTPGMAKAPVNPAGNGGSAPNFGPSPYGTGARVTV